VPLAGGGGPGPRADGPLLVHRHHRHPPGAACVCVFVACVRACLRARGSAAPIRPVSAPCHLDATGWGDPRRCPTSSPPPFRRRSGGTSRCWATCGTSWSPSARRSASTSSSPTPTPPPSPAPTAPSSTAAPRRCAGGCPGACVYTGGGGTAGGSGPVAPVPPLPCHAMVTPCPRPGPIRSPGTRRQRPPSADGLAELDAPCPEATSLACGECHARVIPHVRPPGCRPLPPPTVGRHDGLRHAARRLRRGLQVRARAAASPFTKEPGPGRISFLSHSKQYTFSLPSPSCITGYGGHILIGVYVDAVLFGAENPLTCNERICSNQINGETAIPNTHCCTLDTSSPTVDPAAIRRHPGGGEGGARPPRRGPAAGARAVPEARAGGPAAGDHRR